MVDPPQNPAASSRPPTPRWVKALALAGVGAVLLVVIVMLVAGGQHGPRRHGAATDGDQAVARPQPADRRPAGESEVWPTTTKPSGRWRSRLTTR